MKNQGKITVTFLDQGQDFLEWDIDNGEVIDCRPFQGWMWNKTRVINIVIKPGDYLQIILPGKKSKVSYLAHPVIKVRHTRSLSPAGTGG